MNLKLSFGNINIAEIDTDPNVWRLGDERRGPFYLAYRFQERCLFFDGYQLPGQSAFAFDDVRGLILAIYEFMPVSQWNAIRLDPRSGGPHSLESLGMVHQ